MGVKVLLVMEAKEAGSVKEALALLDEMRESVQPAFSYGLSLYTATREEWEDLTPRGKGWPACYQEG